MCGIAGYVRLDGERPDGAVEAAVRSMLDAQAHRGPDDHGLLTFPGVVLGHRRLSILDLSNAARQPLSNETGTVWVTYNGEIYNFSELRAELVARGHRFECQSDTEVVVHGYEEWGIGGLLQRLDGMFAFCIYDAPRRAVLLARDRVGIKPLYYSWDGQRLVFASEVKAIQRSGLVKLQRDEEALAGFLAFGSIPSPATQFREVRCAAPASIIELQRSGLTEHRYWSLAERGAVPLEPLPELLKDSVRRHLIADVETGVFLSGGIDSGALVSLARQAGVEKLTTLTVAFEESAFNEENAAQRVAQAFRTDHRQLVLRRADFLESLPNLFGAMDQPSVDGANSYFVSWMARKAGVKVALSGLGADEVFWGYHYYQWLTKYRRAFEILARGPGLAQGAAEQALRAVGMMTGQDRWSRFLAAPGNFAGALYGFLRGFLSPRWIGSLLGLDDGGVRRLFERQWNGPALSVGGETPARMFNRIEMSRYLHDTLLRDTDCFSMAHSIEVRVPFLDRAVMERAALEPDSAKVHPTLNKPLLVRAVPPLPVESGWRGKKGFVFPVSEWMRAEPERFRAYVDRVDFLDRKAVRELWDGFLQGRTHWSRAWGMVALGARF